MVRGRRGGRGLGSARWLVALVLLGTSASAEEAPEAPGQAADAPTADATAGSPSDADAADLAASALRSITVTSQRIPEDLVEVPAAVGVVDRADVQLGRQQIGLDESLVKIPGLFLQNRYNFAQDLRISSRGFGARSSFGIRGLKVFVDGIPATLPDGQTGVDDIDIGSIERMEVMRGPSSSLYGPAAGGVIAIFSEDPPEQSFAQARLSFGEFGFEKYQLKAGGRARSLGYFVSASHFSLDGHREHSRTRTSMLNAKLRYEIDPTSDLTATFNATDSPRADDPGGLTAEEAREDPRQASANNLLYDVGERLDQQRLGLFYRKSFGGSHEVAVRNYYVWRDFSNLLPGSSVDLERFFLGGGLGYAYTDDVLGRPNRLAVGFDVDAQRDRRKGFDNQRGVRGSLVRDQDEDVTSYGVYLQDRLDLGWNLRLSAGVRWDRVEFRVNDRLLSDGDQSDGIHFDEISPAGGVLWSPLPSLHVYANFSTSFETPTTREFADPEGGGGFNTALEPQTATNYEIGVKGLLPGRLRYGLALFAIDVRDELVPYYGIDDRTYYRNAGRSKRRGVELDLAVEPMHGVLATLAYTYSDFSFDEYQARGEIYDGNRIPGIPCHQLFGELGYRHASGFYATWDALYVGAFYADDANSVETDPYWVSSLRVGHRLRIRSLEIAPFLGVNNLFDQRYDANIRINAPAERFFEPAPSRHFYGGLSVGYAFGG